MANMEGNTPSPLRPTLTDIDVELLRNILVQEAKYFQQACNAVGANGLARPLDPLGEESNSPLVKIAASLLRHGLEVQEIHRFFSKLTPPRYLTRLACRMEDHFQVVALHTSRTPYSGSETTQVTNKESGSQLHPQELEVYECALLAAQYPVLGSSQDSLDIANQSTAGKQNEQSDLELSISPASRECISYGRDPISRSIHSVFEIEPDDLTELVRQAFCLTRKRHEYYLREVEKTVMNDPAKVLVKEMRELQLIFSSECHPYFHADLFRRREDYDKWLNMEKSALENIIRDQEKYVKAEVTAFPSDVPLVNKDKHSWYKRLLAILFRAESANCWINVATKEAIPKKPLSPASSRLLEEFGERYRIGLLYRRVSLLEYLARNFESKKWYCNYVISVLQSILEFGDRDGFIVRRDEIEIVKTAMTYFHGYIEHSLTRVNRVFPKNSPEGGLREVIRVLSWLVVVDQDDIFGEHSGLTVRQYLKKYAKEEMQTNYERQKIIIADQLKMRTFAQQSSPRMINLMILDISEKLRNYRMYFKHEFIGYFDIVEMAVEVFYSLLMEDVLELCNIHPVNHQPRNIDYLMIALAYRLTSFDHDTAWENYLSLEGQIWRPSFLKHSFAWMTSLHGKLHHLICTALQHDTWQGLHTDHTGRLDSMTSHILHQSEQRTRPREIPSPLTGSPSTRSITPSHNSAFVQVSSRNASTVDKEFSSNHSRGGLITSDINNQSPRTHDDITANQPSCSNVEVSKAVGDTRPEKTTSLKIPSKSSSSNLLKYVQSTKFPAGSVTSQSSESVYTDARSHASDVEDDMFCNDAENDQVTCHQDYTTIPVSSSLIDTVSGINRLINVVRHFSQLLCPKKPVTGYNSLRLSPESRNEMHDSLEQGRVDMAKKLGDMVESRALFYGYYIIGCESCGMSEDVLEPIIGQGCATASRSLIQENGMRPCRHRSAGLERCNTANSQGNCTPSCVANTAQSERVVEEMCVRLNNVRTMKKLLPTLVETAVHNVLAPCPGIDCTIMAVSDISNPLPNLATTSQHEASTSASSAIPNDVVDKHSIEKTVEELQEIENGLVKLMAYRANDVIKKLLQLLLTLNLRSFNSRKRLQPVLNTARKTVHTLAVSLYPDCYSDVLRHFWLAIVKDFAEEKENLVFLTATAKEQANLLLEAISYFIEIFRAEEDSIPLSFVSTAIEPVLQSLNYYTLPTRTLIQMYEALQQRNTSAGRISDGLSSRHRYQRRPSNVFIGRLRIELHSENSTHFSGRRFVECVSNRIRLEGNLGLGICAVPNGCDADSGRGLGKYLLENDILCYVGKVVEKTADHDDSDDDDDLDQEIQNYPRSGGALFISKGKTRHALWVNGVPIDGSQETHSSMQSLDKSDSTIIIQENADKPSRFVDSENVLYTFKSLELDKSLSSDHAEYHQVQGDNAGLNDITTVLFTRRNIEQEARDFLVTLETDVLQELEKKLSRNSISNCCWPRTPLLAVNL